MISLKTSRQPRISRAEKLMITAAAIIGIVCGVIAWRIRPGSYSIERMGSSAIGFTLAFSVLGALLGSLGLFANPRAAYMMSGLLYVYLMMAFTTPDISISWVAGWWAAFLTVICISEVRKKAANKRALD